MRRLRTTNRFAVLPAQSKRQQPRVEIAHGNVAAGWNGQVLLAQFNADAVSIILGDSALQREW